MLGISESWMSFFSRSQCPPPPQAPCPCIRLPAHLCPWEHAGRLTQAAAGPLPAAPDPALVQLRGSEDREIESECWEGTWNSSRPWNVHLTEPGDPQCFTLFLPHWHPWCCLGQINHSQNQRLCICFSFVWNSILLIISSGMHPTTCACHLLSKTIPDFTP